MQVHRNKNKSGVYHEITCMQESLTTYLIPGLQYRKTRSLWRTIAYCDRAIGKVHGSHRSRHRYRFRYNYTFFSTVKLDVSSFDTTPCWAKVVRCYWRCPFSVTVDQTVPGSLSRELQLGTGLTLLLHANYGFVFLPAFITADFFHHVIEGISPYRICSKPWLRRVI